MPAKLENQFKARGIDPAAVIEYAKIKGSFQAMDHFGVKDFVSWRRFLKEVGGDENIGFVPAKSTLSPMAQLMEACARKLAAVTASYEARIRQKDQEIVRLKDELALYRNSDDPGLLAEVEELIKELNTTPDKRDALAIR